MSDENQLLGKLQGEVDNSDIHERGDAHGYFEWNHECDPFELSDTGYEDVDFSKYTSEWYRNQSDPDAAEQEIADIFLDKGIFPVVYYSEDGVADELMKLLDAEVGFTGDYVKNGHQGRAYGNWRFPNLHRVKVAQQGINRGSMYDKFFNLKDLKQAIRFSLGNGEGTGNPITPQRVYSSMRLVGGSASNFKATDAKAIYERFTPEGGVIWDPCMGFGGRMLGAMSSKNDYKYIGTDPNTETVYHLLQQKDDLCTVGIDTDNIDIHCAGSENFAGMDNEIDFVFTSPPYFNLEIYSDEPTQSYNEFSEIEGWLEGYVRPTCAAIRKALKPGALAAINIADSNSAKDTGSISFVDAWSKISGEEGVPLDSEFYLGVSARAGTAAKKNGGVKKERVLVFRKN